MQDEDRPCAPSAHLKSRLEKLTKHLQSSVFAHFYTNPRAPFLTLTSSETSVLQCGVPLASSQVLRKEHRHAWKNICIFVHFLPLGSPRGTARSRVSGGADSLLLSL